jgi:crotonobetainyl-CoA:carnitine CoA-transferase CaiB-like acyl-CoA transferase
LFNPFSDLLVVSVEQALAAPLCTSRLVDMGARVIKIERAEGDFARGYDSAANGDSSYFLWTNHGKESVVLDLKSEKDRKLMRKLIKNADVFVQNLGPGVMKRLGFSSEKMRKANPRMITCDISGYGESGPASDLKAYDLLVQAESGLIDISGGENELGRIGVSVCDIGAGMTAHAAIVEALFYRERTGQGYGVNISLFGVASDWMNVPLIQYKYGGKSPKRVGLMHPTIQPYAAFSLKDGSKIVIAIQNEREWARFCVLVLKQPNIATDIRFNSNNARVANVKALHKIINSTSSVLSVNEFTSLLKKADIAFGSVNSVAALANHVGLNLVKVETSKGDEVQIAAPPINRTIDTRNGLPPPPKLGEHTTKVFKEFGV